MFSLILALSLHDAPAHAASRTKKSPFETCCEAPARTPDEENFERKRRQASELEARRGMAQEDALVRSMADQYAGRVSSEAGISQLAYSSNRYDSYYYRGGGWDCRVNISHGVTNESNNCRDTFRATVGCTSGTSNFSRTYSDQTPRMLEQNGRCYQPGYTTYLPY